MNYSIQVTSYFSKQAKRLVKKYPSLKEELSTLIESLSQNPHQGTALGHECYKIRLAIASKGKGKSGGARIITHIQVVEEQIFLLSIYDKSEQSDISDDILKELLRNL